MKIRTLISAGAALALVPVLFITFALVASLADVRGARALDNAADELTRAVWQLRLLIVQTTLGTAPRVAEWSQTNDALKRLIDDGALASATTADAVERIRAGHANLDILYSQLVSSAGADAGPNQVADPAQRARVMTALLSASQMMFDDALQIVRRTRGRIDAAQDRALAMVITLIAMLAIIVAGNWLLMRKRVLLPITELQLGTERIAAGNFAHRVGIATHDEIGALSRSFDHMSEQLQATRLKLEAEIAERSLIEADLRAAQESLRLMIDSVVDYAILRMNADGHITSWNTGAERIKGYHAHEIIGESYARFFTREDVERDLPRRLLEIAAKEGRAEHEGARVRKDGSVFWGDVIITAVRDAQGVLRSFTEITRDLTAPREAAEALQRLNEKLEHRVAERTLELEKALEDLRASERELELKVGERTAQLESANRELEAFSYSVSHDLRAPLRHIGGYANLLREDCESLLPEDGRRYLRVITDSVKRMGDLIDDLLAFSRMGRQQMRKTQVRMDNLVDEARNELASELNGRCVDWTIDPLPEMPGDPAMLKQVWMNLLGNAIKYTRGRDCANIAIGCHPLNGQTEFFVRDNGVGFDMKYVDKLFGVFQRLHRSEEFEGTGVGLANVRRIVARHGGETRAEAKPDAGATFYFTLPNSGSEQ